LKNGKLICRRRFKLREVKFRDDPENRQRADRIRNIHNKPQVLTVEESKFWDKWKTNQAILNHLYRRIEDEAQRSGQIVQIKTRFKDYGDELWFAWNLDWRTRIYPIAGLGSPQGSPCERYSLRFRDAHHLSPDGEKNALRAIGAALDGTKGSITSRIETARNNLDLIRVVASGEGQALSIAESADEPLQLIQLCRQWVAHEHGKPWSAPIYADATNSGFQIVAGLMNSTTGLHKTNVCRKTEDDAPNDAYSECRELVVQWLEDENKELPKLCRKGEHWMSEIRQQLIAVMRDAKKAKPVSVVAVRSNHGSVGRLQFQT